MAKGKFGLLKGINKNLQRSMDKASQGYNSDGTKYNEFKPRGKPQWMDPNNG